MEDVCNCGHTLLEHSRFIGLACEKCTECTGWGRKSVPPFYSSLIVFCIGAAILRE